MFEGGVTLMKVEGGGVGGGENLGVLDGYLFQL